MKRFDVITIFPEVVAPYAEASILGKAQKKDLIKIQAHNLRDYSTDPHKKVDDTPYGGGAGMVMGVQPFDAAVQAIASRAGGRGGSETLPYAARVVLTSASGARFTQADAKRLAEYDQVIFLCGRYEGVDYRVEEAIADESLSIGDYVLTGGELPALVMIDAIARQIPGVLGNEDTLKEESHGDDSMLEYPQYTKPPEYLIKGKKLVVPDVLMSGNHAKIKKWRTEQQKKAF
ncbi:MAG: tRNA (guanosine(37)-N1)-methyltransferase TrmD [Patescibacteria group bacterium]|jgi:tRNA (guanine37-N1)-methyltransferase